jgi:hypothetical protein
MAIGYKAMATAGQQLVLGSPDFTNSIDVENMYFNAVTSTTPVPVIVNGAGGSGTNNKGSDITIAAGKSTGNADSPMVQFAASDVQASGTTLQSLSTKAFVDRDGFSIGSVVLARTVRQLLYEETNDATSTVLTVYGGKPTYITQSGSVCSFNVMINGIQTSGSGGTVGDVGAYEIKGCVKNLSGTTTLVGSLTKTVIAEDNASWDVTVVANDTNETIDVTVTGVADCDIAWSAEITILINGL